jgi:hypothetical protein
MSVVPFSSEETPSDDNPYGNTVLDPDFNEAEEREHEELEATDIAKGMQWYEEPERFDNFLDVEYGEKQVQDFPPVRPSEFVEIAFRMPGEKGYKPFSFNGRRHMRQPYDTPCKRVLLVTARQVEKSTLLGNKALSYSCLVPGFRTLYVSPSSTQTKTFSNDRLKEPIETSDVLKGYTTSRLSMNVFEKQFINWSKITLRYAFLNADRVRGIPSWMLLLDEFQDIIGDNVPIIEQCTSHAPKVHRRFVYAGTPKSLDNNIETYRANLSTQGEWMVPCDFCGSKVKGGPGRYWNILGEKNIGKKSLICANCGKRLNPQHNESQWAFQVAWHPKKAPFESYRIPQLMVPWKDWNEILLDYQRYSRNQFYNEVLGLSFDSGLRPLTPAHVEANCKEHIRMHPNDLAKYEELGLSQPIFMGVDWGTGENSYTVVVLATYIDMKFTVFYVHRFIGPELDPPMQLEILCDLIKRFNVRLVGADYGGGFDRNDHLIRKFGPERIQKYQYMARCKSKVDWDPKLKRWKVHRTEVMSDLFNAIKRTQFDFPRWEEFRDPYGADMCNIFSEYNESLRQIQYSHKPDRPDDTFHALVFGFLASMIVFRRPDIIAPKRELPNQGFIQNYSSYSGPKYQG